MNDYKYVAARPDGSIVKGICSASSVDGLKRELELRQLLLIQSDQIIPRAHVRLNAEKTAEFCRSLASLLSAGISAAKALDIIAVRESDESAKQSYRYLLSLVESGENLSASMEKTKGMFPELLIRMMEVGEKGGRLDRTVARMADYYERLYRIKNEVRSAMSYPIMLFVITLLVVVAVFSFIFPMFKGLFEGMELPLLTRVMMAVSDLFTKHLWLIFIVLIAVTVLLWWLLGLSSVKRSIDRMKYHLPIVGKLFRILSTADLARVLAALYSGGMPILRALEVSGDSCGAYISSQFSAVVSRVRAGSTISAVLSGVDGLDVKLHRSIAVGEESGKLDEMLIKLSESLDAEASVAIKKLIRFIEPVMIFVAAVLILLVVLSVMIPIYDMYQHIGGPIL